MEHLNGCLHLIISMCKFYTNIFYFSRISLFSCNRGIRVLLCFHPVFAGSITCLKFVFLQLFLIFWIISIFFLLVRKIYFLTHFSPVLSLCRNQAINLNCLLIAWFIYYSNAGLKWIIENLTSCLLAYDNTRMETLTCFRKMFRFPCKTGMNVLLTLSFCFNGTFTIIHIKSITSPHNI